MDLKEVMKKERFVVLGDTLNPEKYAYRIKQRMLYNGYTVYGVGKERDSLNDVPGEIQIVDLCMNPSKSLALLKENRKPFEGVVIQPGAEGPELEAWLEENQIPYIHGCLLVGLSAYGGLN